MAILATPHEDFFRPTWVQTCLQMVMVIPFGGIMQFKDRASLDAYPKHPAHQALLTWLAPLIHAIELDLRS